MSFSISASESSIPELRIRAFRAVDDFESCMKFRLGHLGVLGAFGFKLSSATEEWMFHPDTYVIVIESPEGEVYGGSRLQKIGDKLQLPIQSAVGEEIPNLDEYLSEFNPPVVELCGLWNSVAVAGLGIGSVYSIRAALALAGLLNFQSVIALCSAYTYRISSKYGFRLVESLADGGRIYYDGANQFAHITLQRDVNHMFDSDENERKKIMEIRQNPLILCEELIGNGITKIEYALSI